jgi:adenosylcobyric acid synthase
VLDYLAEGLVKEDASLFNYAEFKEKQYDKLADHVRAHVDMDAIYRSLTE